MPWSIRSSPPAVRRLRRVGAGTFVAMDVEQKLHRIGQIAFA
jgi:hypothetical protein